VILPKVKHARRFRVRKGTHPSTSRHTPRRTIRAGELTIKNNFNTKYWNGSNKAPLLGNVG